MTNDRSKPNLLHVCLAEGYGGLEKFFLTSSNYLKERFNVRLLIKKGSDLEPRVRETDFNYSTLRFINYIDVRAMYRIRSIVQKNNIDCVYFQGSSELGLIVPALLGLDVKLLNRKSVTVTSSKKDFYHDLIYNGVDEFVAPTPYFKENLLEKYPVDEEKINVIPNAIEIERFRKSTYPSILEDFHEKDDHTFITSLSRVVPEKGIESFVKMANHFARKNPKHVFFVVGDGPDHFLSELRQIRDDSLGDRIIFTGFQENVPAVLNQTDLFVSFARHEHFGNNILEAKTMGLPILASNTVAAQFHLKEYPEFIVEHSKLEDRDLLETKISDLVKQYPTVKYDLEPFQYDTYVSDIERLARK